MSDSYYHQEELDRRRRDRRFMDRFLWMVVGAMIAMMAVMALVGVGTSAAGAADTATARVTCNDVCQVNRRLVVVCPAQPGSMTRARCVQWVQVSQCEAGGQQRRVTVTSIGQIGWRTNSAYDGGLQFRQSTWTSNVARIPSLWLTRPERQARTAGRYHHAYSAPASVQILAAEVLRGRSGLGQWPHCQAWWYNG